MARCYVVAALASLGLLALYFLDSSVINVADSTDSGVVTADAAGKVAPPPPSPSPPSHSCLQYSGWGPNTTSGLDNGYWYYSKPNVSEPDCVREFRVDNGACSVHRFTHAEAISCLAGKHIVYIGDSLSRYLFQALYVWLESGSPPDPLNAIEPHQTNAWIMEHHGFGGCGGSLRCDRVGEKTLDNMYYYNAEHNLNVTYVGYSDHG